MSYKLPRFAVTITLLTLMSACASKAANERPNSLRSNSVKTQLKMAETTHAANTLKHWEMTGAMAARSNKKGWTATFNWRQKDQDNYQIRLIGPLGGGTVLINRHKGITTYRDGKKTSSAHNSESLLKQKTGIALPTGNLYYWGRGLPAPGPIKSIEYDSSHHLKRLQQAGYTIEYPSFTNVYGMELPKKIKLQGNGITIKVAIKQWKF